MTEPIDDRYAGGEWAAPQPVDDPRPVEVQPADGPLPGSPVALGGSPAAFGSPAGPGWRRVPGGPGSRPAGPVPRSPGGPFRRRPGALRRPGAAWQPRARWWPGVLRRPGACWLAGVRWPAGGIRWSGAGRCHGRRRADPDHPATRAAARLGRCPPVCRSRGVAGQGPRQPVDPGPGWSVGPASRARRGSPPPRGPAPVAGTGFAPPGRPGPAPPRPGPRLAPPRRAPPRLAPPHPAGQPAPPTRLARRDRPAAAPVGGARVATRWPIPTGPRPGAGRRSTPVGPAPARRAAEDAVRAVPVRAAPADLPGTAPVGPARWPPVPGQARSGCCCSAWSPRPPGGTSGGPSLPGSPDGWRRSPGPVRRAGRGRGRRG